MPASNTSGLEGALPPDGAETRLATFGAGCFWGVEQILARLPGVVDTALGYMGGASARPTYEQVCTDTTEHAEVVQVTWDPSKISYDALLDVFWHLHDPTQVDRQGRDAGRQYRSVVVTHDDDQARIARETKASIDARGTLLHCTEKRRGEPDSRTATAMGW